MNKKKIFYVTVFLFFCTILFLSPISGDDWGNYGVGKLGLYHSIGNAVGMYFSWEGRFISRILINILTYHKYIWNIINSFLITLTIYFSLKFIKPKNKSMIYILSLLIILLMNIYTFSQTITWIAGNITYFFVIPIILGYFYYLFEERKNSNLENFLFIATNIIGPMFVEHMALVLITGNVLILLHRFQKKGKWDKKIIIYIILSTISTSIMLLSPGSRARSLMENIEFNSLGLFGKIAYNIPNFINYTFIVNSYMLILTTISNYLQIKNTFKNKYLKIILITFIIPIPLFTIILYPLSNFYESSLQLLINQNNIFVIIYWILYLIFSLIMISMTSIKENKTNSLFLFLIGISANGFMLLSPTWGYRTSLFTEICISISALIVLDYYLKLKKTLYMKIFTVGIMLFYVVLYINVYRCQSHLIKSIKEQVNSNKKVIEVEQFPNFINCNINPESEYHIIKFKEYYGIDKKCEVKLTSKNWRYLIIYK